MPSLLSEGEVWGFGYRHLFPRFGHNIGGLMKWRFDCFVCGLRWEENHKDIHEAEFVFSKKKEGRPMVDCPSCYKDDIHTPLMGDMVGNRR